MDRIDGKVAAVTGGAHGLGAAIAFVGMPLLAEHIH